MADLLPRSRGVRVAVLSAMLAIGVGFLLVLSRDEPDASIIAASTSAAASADETTLAAIDGTLATAVSDEAPLVPVVPGNPTDTVTSDTSAPAGPPPLTVTLDVQVLDDSGQPFPSGDAGVSICRWKGPPQTECPANLHTYVGDADGDGHIAITLQSGSFYGLLAVATGTGWAPSWRDHNGTAYNFSDGVDIEVSTRRGKVVYSVSGDGRSTFPVFTIGRPASAVVRVVDGDGHPFPPGVGGVKACVVDGSGECPADNPRWRVAHDDDGDGTVEVGLDPGVAYEVQGIANGTGWCDPWKGADGQDWHFGNTVSPVTADQLQGRVFVVPNPCPPTSTTEPAVTAAGTTTMPTTIPAETTIVTVPAETTTTATITTGAVTTTS